MVENHINAIKRIIRFLSIIIALVNYVYICYPLTYKFSLQSFLPYIFSILLVDFLKKPLQN